MDSLFIPLIPAGLNLFFESCVPTHWELENLQVVELTAPHWNPVMLNMSTQHDMSDYAVRQIAMASTLSESATLLSSVSSALDYCQLISLHTSVITVPDAPTGTALDCCDSCIATTITGERHLTLTPESLSRIWNIGINTAKCTLQVTTQRGIFTAIHPLHRQYRVNHLHLNRRQ